MRALLIATLLAAACGGDQMPAADMGTGLKLDLSFHSNCGQPGDPGNSLGVGKFCYAASNTKDCGGNTKATLCAQLGDPDQHFCTFMCTRPVDGGVMDECGEGAKCACSSGGCGCYPDACN